MKYIFFDIECANCFQGKGKICSFGYVVTDTSFNVIEKYDLVINPASKFNLGPEIVLAYDKKTFKHSPMFPDYYCEITELLEDEDSMVFGFSASNDARYLNYECMRYDLPGIDYVFYDVQQILMGMKDIKNQPSLLGSCLEYGIEENQDVHKSDDDSLMTMELLREICSSTGKTPAELVNEYKQCIGIVSDYEFKWQYPPERPHKDIQANYGMSNRLRKNSSNYKVFEALVKNATPTGNISNVLAGKTICLSTHYEEKHFRQMLVLVQLIVNAGGRYVTRLKEANCFVHKREYGPNKTLRRCYRYETVRRFNKNQNRIEISPFDEFLELLSISEKELDETADAILTQKQVLNSLEDVLLEDFDKEQEEEEEREDKAAV